MHPPISGDQQILTEPTAASSVFLSQMWVCGGDCRSAHAADVSAVRHKTRADVDAAAARLSKVSGRRHLPYASYTTPFQQIFAQTSGQTGRQTQRLAAEAAEARQGPQRRSLGRLAAAHGEGSRAYLRRRGAGLGSTAKQKLRRAAASENRWNQTATKEKTFAGTSLEDEARKTPEQRRQRTAAAVAATRCWVTD